MKPFATPEGRTRAGAALPPGEERPADPIAPLLVRSLAFHAAVALLIIFGLPLLARPPADMPRVVTVDLVRLAAVTEAPRAEQKAAIPQQQALEMAKPEAAKPVPQPPPPPAAESGGIPGAAPPVSTAAPKRKQDTPRMKTAASRARHSTEPRPAVPLAAIDLDAKLHSLSTARELQTRLPEPRAEYGRGMSNADATTDKAAAGPRAAYAVKDFLRAQIEQRWYLDRDLKDVGFAVSIHLKLNRDGSVAAADIVDDPRRRPNDKGYDIFRALALSARNAVLLSSPLRLPPGRYDEVRDITLTFDPRDTRH